MNDSIKREQSKRVWFAERENYRLKGKKVLAAVLMGLMLTGCNQKSENYQNEESMNTTLTLTQEWDKVFPQSDKVDHKKGTFKNRYGIELAADMYTPKGATGKLAALAVTGPFGAVKEQEILGTVITIMRRNNL